MRLSTQKGISIIEVLLVLGILILLSAAVLPKFSKTREQQVVKVASADIINSIGKARSQTLASVNSSEYGVHLQSDKVILFKGKVYSAGATDNETVSILSPATISNVTLGGVSGTSGDLYFNRLTGAPNQSGTATISSPSFTITVTISATGVASAN
jgi:Tfp pilus assembly protein FimT